MRTITSSRTRRPYEMKQLTKYSVIEAQTNKEKRVKGCGEVDVKKR